MSSSDEEMKARVAARCAELGKSLRGALSEAGLSHETLEKTPAAGRRLDTLEKLARVLDWSLADLLGLEVIARLEPGLLHTALQVVRSSLPHIPEIDPVFSEMVALAYNILADGHPDPQQPPGEEVIANMTRTIAKIWTNNQFQRRR
jgi:hypothetical protein